MGGHSEADDEQTAAFVLFVGAHAGAIAVRRNYDRKEKDAGVSTPHAKDADRKTGGPRYLLEPARRSPGIL
jgi:hypothetical protein